MRNMLKGLLVLAGGCLTAAVVQGSAWHFYSPPEAVGSIVEDSGQKDLKSAAALWLEQYTEQLEGWKVPYGYRLLDERVMEVQVLDGEAGYVQIDYLIKPASGNYELLAYYNATEYGYGWYQAQTVLKLVAHRGEYQVMEQMSPVQYQIATDPALQEEIEPPSYEMQDEECTYVFRDQKLYVTYDYGKSMVEVPVPYEDIAGTNNGGYDEYIGDNSRIITREFTAFVAYTGSYSYLIYSTDAGESWNESRIYDSGYRSVSYLSRTETRCYVSLAVDRSLGHDYYGTFMTADFSGWELLSGEAFQGGSYSCVWFAADGIGYLASGGADGGGNCVLYYTEDNGASAREITLPADAPAAEKLGYNPFTEVENIYRENGRIFLIVGQGDSGDYARDGKLVKALYVSDDGMNFSFAEEMFDQLVEVG